MNQDKKQWENQRKLRGLTIIPHPVKGDLVHIKKLETRIQDLERDSRRWANVRVLVGGGYIEYIAAMLLLLDKSVLLNEYSV